ncbi:MAG TPA: XRE family transcriptional regulator [Morganella sp. (in: Bacteria)]|nr:XRE family transcriptional regulator [Morganella sp. (in: enterobacteria)]
MTKIKGISHSDVKKQLLNTPESLRAYENTKEEFDLLVQLTEWRKLAGMSRAEVAEKMGVTPPAITKLERNITKATWLTLKRYAQACGVNISLTANP